MPQREDFSERAGDLERLGVPPHVVQYIRDQIFPNWRARYAGYVVLVVVLTLGVTVAAAAAVSWFIGRLEAQRLQRAYFVASNHGWSVAMLGLGVFLLAGGFLSRLHRRFSRRFAEYAAIRNLISAIDAEGAAGGLTRAQLRREIEIAGATDPPTFLHQHGYLLARYLVIAGASLLALWVPSVLADVQDYDLGTERGVERHSLFGTELLPWTSLKKVETGCSDLEESPPSGHFELVFDGSARVDAFPEPPDRASLWSLWELNLMLRGRAVPVEQARFERGIHAGEQVWAAGCVEAVAGRAGVEPGMVGALLITTEDLEAP
ncbi:hypothetical protein ACSRUE_20200 [Sorangium sp. KYC3313]|uniref:hypothetical protein n=1 Tax=Sorangium sp. KYC3313 TaxID=3449740 RepID=UPI003F8CE928